ncbi:MAG TPA: FliH/SctL family protein [Burkholderiales bacterium]|nr:FliH/SctL family protein [Burkholderiales bacterium]
MLLRVQNRAAAPPATDAQVKTAAAAAPSVPDISYEEYEQRFAAELQALRDEARERGRQEGREAGLAKATAEHAAQLKALAGLVRGARGRLDEGIGELSELGAEVVYEAVCKLLGQVFASREGVIAAVREVVRGARERSRLTVRVSPSDYATIRAHLDKVLEGLEAGAAEVVADERVELGGCLLETPSGSLDGRLEVQLANLRLALLAAHADGKQAPDQEEISK